MKKLIVISTMFFFVVTSGCKKEENHQLSRWERFWVKEQYVMVDLNNQHKNVILPKIDQIRTTIEEFVMWDEDTIQVHGPGGYTPTAEKAWEVWLGTYHKLFMPDTLPPKSGELANIIQTYLELRRKYDRDKSFTKMHLCIPKEIYEQDSRFWEWWLSKVQTYLTVTLGGPDAWTDGTRQLWQEMEIYHLPTTPDPQDPWGCNCSAQTRITDWYLNYAEGPEKKIVRANEVQIMKDFRQKHGEIRYENFLSSPKPFSIGSPVDHETKFGIVNGVEVYYIKIPCVPTRK